MKLNPLIKMPLVILVLFSAAIFAPQVQADEIYTFVVKKQEEKAKNRWSLSEWLETRDRMRLMDLWLALHSPSPYEFYVGGGYQWAASPGTASIGGSSYFGGGYASIFGLGGSRASLNGLSGNSELMDLFFLRVFGFHAQGTNITLQAGVRSVDAGTSTFRGAVAGVSSSVYIGRHFGLQGLYRHAFDTVPGASGTTRSGARYEGGAFIDFSFVRIFGNYFSAPETEAGSSGSVELKSSGYSLGTQLFF